MGRGLGNLKPDIFDNSRIFYVLKYILIDWKSKKNRMYVYIAR